MAQNVRLKNSPRETRVLVLLLPDVHLQDLAGPVQVLDEAAQLGGAYRMVFCGVERRVRSAQGLELSNLEPLPTVHPTDLVLVPGMSSAALPHLEHVPTAWLVEAERVGARVASVCSGAFALARAGLLDGRDCTTHWKLVERLRRERPRANVLDNRLFVEDRGVVTSAGVAAGIDMSLYVVARLLGRAKAEETARYIEYPWPREENVEC
jgi:transcriptional regulator GlxA family with amidase domain